MTTLTVLEFDSVLVSLASRFTLRIENMRHTQTRPRISDCFIPFTQDHHPWLSGFFGCHRRGKVAFLRGRDPISAWRRRWDFPRHDSGGQWRANKKVSERRCLWRPRTPLARRRPGYSLSGCVPAEPDSASPSALIISCPAIRTRPKSSARLRNARHNEIGARQGNLEKKEAYREASEKKSFQA
ncbi:MAG: hypothetical protein DDT34_02371 [Firmicutes bacterium]|nr:hypothetical protein [Bacillota bacterium]